MLAAPGKFVGFSYANASKVTTSSSFGQYRRHVQYQDFVHTTADGSDSTFVFKGSALMISLNPIVHSTVNGEGFAHSNIM